MSKVCTVLYGMPGKTEGLDDSSYIYMGFEEGWRWTYLLELFRLYKCLRTRRRKLYLVHFYSTNLILFGPIVAYLAGVPSIVTVTGFGRVFNNPAFPYKGMQILYWFLMKLSIRLSQYSLFQNHADMKFIEERYPGQASKLIFIGSAVDFPEIKDKDFFAPKLRVLLIARVMPDKGIKDFVRVAEELGNDLWEFVLVGPASKGYDDLYKYVRTCHDRGIISFKGECSSAEVEFQLSQAHIFCFPSYGEGLSRTMLEAGFAHLCPVAYDISSNRDLVVEGRGFLLPVGDTSSVILTLRRLFADRRLLSTCAHSYQSFITENYSMDKYAERMDSLLQDFQKRMHAHDEYNSPNGPLGS
ncbi:MAG TPA: glycosyltransferase [Bacteroidales bacterium]|nr:glycosyltransferase [Bacteroidales bacterium]